MYNDDVQETQQPGGNFLLGFVCGAAIGAALGLVFAPKSGAETRRQLAESGDRIRKNAARTYHQTADNVGSFISRGREAVARGRDVFVRTREQATNTPPAQDTFPTGPLPTA
jgi:gas vesicle protein